MALATLKDMGANSVAMGVSEVYSGMQTGVIDGAENNPPTFIAHNYMPIAKNYTSAATSLPRKCCSTQK